MILYSCQRLFSLSHAKLTFLRLKWLVTISHCPTQFNVQHEIDKAPSTLRRNLMIWMLCGKDLAPGWRYWEVGKFSGGPMITWGPSLFFLFWGFLAMSQALFLPRNPYRCHLAGAAQA